MKKCYFLLLFAIAGLDAKAQVQATNLVYGKLVEEKSQQPLGFATVGLFSPKDSSLVKGANSAENGTFELTGLPSGNYYLKINQVGFKTKIVPNLSLSSANSKLDLGTLTVASAAKKLSEVEIVAQKNLVEYGLDKQVINVAKDLTSTGGTAADALKNSPSVAVDIDGNVSVRGSSNITVLIDGKNTGQNARTLLSSTPASAIETIEVITNPSAKYDAEGMGGIINIVLKKEKKPGFNGNVMVNLGTSNNYNANLSLNYNIKKFNFFGSYNFMQNAREGNYQMQSFRRGYSQEQWQNGDRLSRMHIPTLGFDYQLSDKQSITVSAKSFMMDMTDDDAINNKEKTERDVYYTRFNLNENDMTGTDLALSYRKTFALKRQEFSSSIVYTIFDGQFDRHIKEQPTNAAFAAEGDESYENYLQNFHVNPLIAQADYVHPIGEKGKFETGLKHNQRVLTSTFRTEVAGPGYSNLTVIPALSNDYSYGDYISAAYANYTNSWKKLNYQVGLRAEQTNIRINNVYVSDKEFTNDYLNFFPSIFLGHDIDENRKVQVNYGRRVNRPNYEALNPFKNYADKQNVTFGDPKLMPEYVDSYEASYLQTWKSGSLTNTLFYRNVHNLIQQVRYLDPVDTLRAYNTYVNLDNAQSYGLEISGMQSFMHFIRLSGNVSVFNYNVSGSPEGIDATSDKISWSTRLNGSVMLPKSFAMQVSFNYRGPQAMAQGTKQAIYNTDIALKKDVMKRKGSISLRVSDVFNTLRYDSYQSGPDFTFDLKSKRQSRIAFLGFSYRFGNEQDKRRRPEVNSGLDGMF